MQKKMSMSLDESWIKHSHTATNIANIMHNKQANMMIEDEEKDIISRSEDNGKNQNNTHTHIHQSR